jgi:hypothetical protein
MCRAQCDDQLAMNDGEPAGGHDQAAITVRPACEFADATFYFVGVATHPAGRISTAGDGHFEPAIRLISPNAGSTH